MSVFYSKQIENFVSDEMCKCGHLKSNHGSLTHRMKDKMIRERSDGSCCSSHCVCNKFTFMRFVSVDEAAELIVYKRTSVVA